MNDTAAKLRALSQAHPPAQRTVHGARYGATGEVVGTSVRKRLGNQRRDHTDAIAAALRALRKARAR